MITVIALGGNALLRRSEPPEAWIQEGHVREAAALLAGVIRAAAPGEHFVITHGNGPQVGLLALQSQQDERLSPYPLDVLDAESEGMIGYLIERELRNHLESGREVATLLTQVEVDAHDPAFRAPDKPIGRVYEPAEAERLATRHGWRFAPEGAGRRRVVPSPVPRAILGLGNIRSLLASGAVVICAGGGGIPVVRRAEPGGGRSLHGVEAVIDKDLVSARLAIALGARRLWLLTDVDAVYERFGEPDARACRLLDIARLDTMQFAPGSMGPKVAAARSFALETGCEAVIASLEDAGRLAQRAAGTRIVAAL